MKKIIYHLLLLFTFVTSLPAAAQYHPESENEYDPSIRRPIRRLHPEREREKAMKELLKQQEQGQQGHDDAWSEPDKSKNDQRRPAATRSPQAQTSTSDKAFLQELLSKDYSLVQIVPDAAKPYVWIDEPVETTENELLASVSRTAQGAALRYMPRGASMENTKNGFYLYFDERTSPLPLRLRVQYYADDPLNFNRIDFLIDGFEYSYQPSQKQSGRVYGKMIWENCDEPLTASDKDLIYALTHCQWARMSLVGHDGINHVKMLSDEQLKGLRTVLQLYLLRGGTL